MPQDPQPQTRPKPLSGHVKYLKHCTELWRRMCFSTVYKLWSQIRIIRPVDDKPPFVPDTLKKDVISQAFLAAAAALHLAREVDRASQSSDLGFQRRVRLMRKMLEDEVALMDHAQALAKRNSADAELDE